MPWMVAWTCSAVVEPRLATTKRLGQWWQGRVAPGRVLLLGVICAG